jgi:hypothetical protein
MAGRDRTSRDTRDRRAKARRTTAIAAVVLGAGVAFVLGVYAKSHAPTGRAPLALGFHIPGEMKIWFTRAAAALALFQLGSGLRLNGRIPFPRHLPSGFGIAHRLSGGLAVLLAAPVAYDCVAAFGFKHGLGAHHPARSRRTRLVRSLRLQGGRGPEPLTSLLADSRSRDDPLPGAVPVVVDEPRVARLDLLRHSRTPKPLQRATRKHVGPNHVVIAVVNAETPDGSVLC